MLDLRHSNTANRSRSLLSYLQRVDWGRSRSLHRLSLTDHLTLTITTIRSGAGLLSEAQVKGPDLTFTIRCNFVMMNKNSNASPDISRGIHH